MEHLILIILHARVIWSLSVQDFCTSISGYYSATTGTCFRKYGGQLRSWDASLSHCASVASSDTEIRSRLAHIPSQAVWDEIRPQFSWAVYAGWLGIRLNSLASSAEWYRHWLLVEDSASDYVGCVTFLPPDSSFSPNEPCLRAIAPSAKWQTYSCSFARHAFCEFLPASTPKPPPPTGCPTALSNDWGFLGCFTSPAADRLLTEAKLTGVGLMSNTVCIEHCSAKGYTASGTTGGNTCYCGMKATINPTRERNLADCSSACSGASGEKCGAASSMTVYIPNPFMVHKPISGEPAIRHPFVPTHYMHWCSTTFCNAQWTAELFCQLWGCTLPPIGVYSNYQILTHYLPSFNVDSSAACPVVSCGAMHTIYCDGVCDVCVSVPCQHNGTCDSTGIQYTCTCLPGFVGTNCETDINECATAMPCQNAATCINTIGSYTCTCAPGYTGMICDLDIDECLTTPCQNAGNCTNTVGSYTCTCMPGFEGQLCEFDIDECTTATPCQNAGTCTNTVGSYTCTCVPGYTGMTCDTDINECLENPCQYDGTCTNTIGSYTCACVPGATAVNCSVNIDECVSNPCENNGTCVDHLNYFTCSCTADWTDTFCNLSAAVAEFAQMYNEALGLDGINDKLAKAGTITDALPFVTYALNESTRMNASWKYDDLIESCTFEEVNCRREDFHMWSDSALGNCFTYNHDKTSFKFKARRAGERSGLKLYLKTGIAEYLPWVDIMGARIFVHNQSEQIFVESFASSVTPGYENLIAIRYTEFQRQTAPYGDCVRSPDEVAKFYYDGYYSKEACIRSCFQWEMNEECGCVDPKYPKADTMVTCTVLQRNCSNAFVAEKGDPTTWADCVCPLPCNDAVYPLSISRVPFRDVMPKCEDLTGNDKQQCYKTQFVDRLRAYIYFEKMASIIYTEVPSFTIEMVLSDLGGQLGILAGVSALSIAEIVFAFCRIIFASITNIG